RIPDYGPYGLAGLGHYRFCGGRPSFRDCAIGFRGARLVTAMLIKNLRQARKVSALRRAPHSPAGRGTGAQTFVAETISEGSLLNGGTSYLGCRKERWRRGRSASSWRSF